MTLDEIEYGSMETMHDRLPNKTGGERTIAPRKCLVIIIIDKHYLVCGLDLQGMHTENISKTHLEYLDQIAS